jgi:hypothetical protein
MEHGAWRRKLLMSKKCYRRGRNVNTMATIITNCHLPNNPADQSSSTKSTIPIICVGGCAGEGSWPDNCLITSMVMIGREPPHYVARCWCMKHNGTYINSEQQCFNSRYLIPNTVLLEVCVRIKVLLLSEYIDKTPVQVWACCKAITVF